MSDATGDIIENLEMVAPTEPGSWILPLAVAGGLLLVFALLFWVLYRKRKLPFQPHPEAPPEVTALEELLKLKSLMEAGEDRKFVIAVSKVLRYYIEARFAIRAPHLSTEEFLFLAEDSDALDSSQKQALAHFLAQCDRVKFALGRLGHPHLSHLYEAAESFIRTTSTPIASESDKEPES